jgi:hypothetical protein
MTNYRSTVGARQPSRVVLHGISISYSDSGGSGPVVICLHAIGHGVRDFEDLSRRLSPGTASSRWTFPTMEIRGQIPSPPAARATRGSWRNSSMSCISQRLCCLATPSAEPFPSVTPVCIPNASRPLCFAIVADSVLRSRRTGLYRRVRAILRCRQARRLLVSVGFCSLLPKSCTETGRAGRTRANYSLSVRDCAHSGASVAKLQ